MRFWSGIFTHSIWIIWMLCLIPFWVDAKPKSKKKPLTSKVLPITDPKLVGEIYQMLKIVDLLFTKYNIPYWIDGGTALGAVRHQGFIPWDDDADIDFFIEDEARIFALADEFKRYGLYLSKEDIFRLYPSAERRYPFIDIFGYALFPDQTLRLDHEFSRNLFTQFYWLPEEVAILKRCKFGPIELNAPNDMMRYLLTGYGADCMSTALFQQHHNQPKNLEITTEKVKIIDFKPAHYVCENQYITLDSHHLE